MSATPAACGPTPARAPSADEPSPATGRLRVVSREAAVASATPPGPAPAAPDLRPLVARLAQIIAEVAAGARSPAQLSAVATLQVVRQLERGSGRFGAGAGQPATRPIVRSVHVSRVEPTVAEACAVTITGARVRALAFRLEAVNDRWQCTAVQLG